MSSSSSSRFRRGSGSSVRPPNDIAIYSPFAYTFYEGPTASPRSGGAELQATLLARELVRRGFKVAHIVYPVANPASPAAGTPQVVERPIGAAARLSSRPGRVLG